MTTVFCKLTDWRNFLHYASAHPRSLIQSISYSQGFCLKNICTEISELSKNLQVLKKSIANWSFYKKFLEAEFERLIRNSKKCITGNKFERKRSK